MSASSKKNKPKQKQNTERISATYSGGLVLLPSIERSIHTKEQGQIDQK